MVTPKSTTGSNQAPLPLTSAVLPSIHSHQCPYPWTDHQSLQATSSQHPPPACSQQSPAPPSSTT
jgi:hypothetical protein